MVLLIKEAGHPTADQSLLIDDGDRRMMNGVKVATKIQMRILATLNAANLPKVNRELSVCMVS